MSQPEKLLSKEEIAALLGCAPRTVWVWSHIRKKFPGVMVGRLRKYRLSVVLKVMVKEDGK